MEEVDRMMRTLTQPRMLASAGLLLLAAGLLWGAFRDEKPDRLPPDWRPVNERLAASAGENDKMNAGHAGSSGAVPPSAAGRNGGGSDAESDGAEPASDGEPAGSGSGAEGTAGVPLSGDAGASGGSPDAASGSAPAAGGFDINRATEAEWDELPGIGPAKARAIVEDRERNGPFRSIDDLARVKGIGPKLLERIKEAIEARNASGG
ncbi:MAG: hypothetical protein C6W55_00605 [Thermobacillus sp.]|nr:MAG: hypothetical protein C6W55_00605 [Thermobacillus sp.]